MSPTPQSCSRRTEYRFATIPIAFFFFPSIMLGVTQDDGTTMKPCSALQSPRAELTLMR